MSNRAEDDEPLTELNVEVYTSSAEVAATARSVDRLEESSPLGGTPSIGEASLLKSSGKLHDLPTVTVTVQRDALPADSEPRTLEPRLGVQALGAKPGLAAAPPSVVSAPDTDKAATHPGVPGGPKTDSDYNAEEPTSKTSSARLRAVAGSLPAPRRKKSPTMQGIGPAIRPIVRTPNEPFRPIASSEVDLRLAVRLTVPADVEPAPVPPTRRVLDVPKSDKKIVAVEKEKAGKVPKVEAKPLPIPRVDREEDVTSTNAEGRVYGDESTAQRAVDPHELDDQTEISPSDRIVAAAAVAAAELDEGVETESRPLTKIPESDDTTAVDTSLLSGGVRLSAAADAASGVHTVDDDSTAALLAPPASMRLPSTDLTTDPGAPPKTDPMRPGGQVQTQDMFRPAFVNAPKPAVPMELQETVAAFPSAVGPFDDRGPRGTLKVIPPATGSTPGAFGQPAAASAPAPAAAARRGGLVLALVVGVVIAAAAGFFFVRSSAWDAIGPGAPTATSTSASAPPATADPAPSASAAGTAAASVLGPLGEPSTSSTPSAGASASGESSTTPAPSASAASADASAKPRVPPPVTTSSPPRRSPPPPPPPRPATKPTTPAPRPSAPMHI